LEYDLQQLDQIFAKRETYAALSQWVEKGNVDINSLSYPLEFGMLNFGEDEYVLFDRNIDAIRFCWFQSGVPHSKFEFMLKTRRLDNIYMSEKLERTTGMYKPFFYVVQVFIGSMAFISAFNMNQNAVSIKSEPIKNETKYVYLLDHQYVDLSREISIIEKIVGPLAHQLNYRLTRS
jgi:hypothetical protein